MNDMDDTAKPLSDTEKIASTQVPASDAPYWAPPVSKLTVESVPGEAMNLNVEGRRVSGPIQGFGRMWRKRHRVVLANALVTPEEVIKTWKEHFGEFWPRGNRFYGP